MISQLPEARFGTVEAAKMVGSVKSGDFPAEIYTTTLDVPGRKL